MYIYATTLYDYMYIYAMNYDYMLLYTYYDSLSRARVYLYFYLCFLSHLQPLPQVCLN